MIVKKNLNPQLKAALDQGSYLQITTIDCTSNQQKEETWKFLFDTTTQDFSDLIRPNNLRYEFLDPNNPLSGDSEGVMFIRDLDNLHKERIRLYPAQERVIGEIRVNTVPSYYDCWELKELVKE